MGVTVHYDFSVAGDARRVWATLARVRRQCGLLPIERLGPLMFLSPALSSVKRGGDSRILLSWLQSSLERCFNVYDLPVVEGRTVLQAIRERATGLGFRVDVADGCEPFRIVVGHLGDVGLWRGGAFTKTAWASNWEHAHGLVMRLLSISGAAGILESVSDEAGWWQEGGFTDLGARGHMRPSTRQEHPALRGGA